MTWRYFKEREMACRHCHECKMKPEFMERLDMLRRKLGFPLIVTSGYRCPTHNSRVSSTGSNGPHTTGRAVDLQIFGHRAFELVQTAMGLGFTGIGVAQKGPQLSRFIHLDDLDPPGHPRPWIWTYA